MIDTPYMPDRSLGAKLRRRLVAWRAARPQAIRLDKGVVTFTFDDFPKSAARFGAKCLEGAGFRGTFYASAGLAGSQSHVGKMFEAEDLASLVASGHEIGCHTLDHEDCALRPLQETLDSVRANGDALAALGLEAPLTSFAFPYGETSLALKQNLGAQFLSVRGIGGGLNAGVADFAQLHAAPMFGRHAIRRSLSLMRAAHETRSWLILFTHDVAPAPSPWGTSPAALERLIDMALRTGLDVLTMHEAASRIVEGPAA